MFSFSNSQPKILALSALVVSLAATILLAEIPSSSGLVFPWIQYHGHIVNELSPNKTLLVDCQCSDSDLGDHYINIGSEYQWSFKPHVFWSTTWHCYLAPDDNSHSYFAAFTDNIENVDAHHNFYWVAKDDGVYMRNNESHQDIYFDKWEVGHYL
ncbi:S-protein homolog 1 [Linum perenne]